MIRNLVYLGLVTVCLAGFCSFVMAGDVSVQIREMEESQQYEASRNALGGTLRSQFSPELMEFWIQADYTLLASVDIKRKNKTEFNPTERGWGEFLLFVFEPSRPNPPGYPPKPEYNEEMRAKRLQKDEELVIELMQPEKILEVSEKFELLKKSVTEAEQILASTNVPEKDVFSSRLKDLKNAIRKQRKDFISYEVTSPYLADAERHLYLAVQKGWFFGLDQKHLDKTVQILETIILNDWCTQCHRDVQEQFLQFEKTFQKSVSKKQYNQLNLQPVVNKLSNPASKDEDFWWK